jgi:hypothetical protein
MQPDLILSHTTPTTATLLQQSRSIFLCCGSCSLFHRRASTAVSLPLEFAAIARA